jgi:hypothetical protein
VGLDQLRRHGQRVVEGGQGGLRVARPGIQNGLRRRFNRLFLFAGGVLRPREVVVDDTNKFGS